jgi:hypothetical protein
MVASITRIQSPPQSSFDFSLSFLDIWTVPHLLAIFMSYFLILVNSLIKYKPTPIKEDKPVASMFRNYCSHCTVAVI